jgi:2-polyprenyl-3-methyl-5-hydroxy-6-metoxy-1,4-benzoquinol methylase
MSCADEHGENFSPAQFLVDNIKLLPRGKVLDIAMGSGRNAIYLAEKGFEVEGVDISEDAVNSALKTAAANGVAIHAEIVDLEHNYQIKPAFYDVIICFNYLPRTLIARIKAGLKINGMIVYETFTIDQPRFGKPHNPDYLLRYNELLDLFRDFRCLRYSEGIFNNTRAIASIIAQKVT